MLFDEIFSFFLESFFYIEITFYPSKRWSYDGVIFSRFALLDCIYFLNYFWCDNSSYTIDRICGIYENCSVFNLFCIICHIFFKCRYRDHLHIDFFSV